MQEITPEARSVLEKMLTRGIVGAHHLLVDNILRRFPAHKRGDVKKAVEDLLRLGLIVMKKTKHGDAIFIPPERLDDVKYIVERAEM